MKIETRCIEVFKAGLYVILLSSVLSLSADSGVVKCAIVWIENGLT